MFRPGWRFFPVPALAALVVLGLGSGGLSLAGLRASSGLPLISDALIGNARAAAGFLSIAEDVPLMPGLAESPDAATVFDKPSGRIAHTEAKGKVSVAAVRKFYADTLPQLGWQNIGPEHYRRETEQLRLSVTGRDGALTVRFELLPNQ
ncbi:hypothetical protein [Ferrovibrio sp.]|uniref:hypothetical protein n=1 Tax=Ferrovibrio sp. TaxID=1917215 RepID=UPI003919D2F6